MAQILKFQSGGTVTPTWGTFTIDNVTYEMTDDNIAKLYNHAKQLDNDVQYQFGFIIDALKSGENLTYANNVLTGNINWDVSDGQNKKIHKRPGRGLGKGRDARMAISSLDDLELTNPQPETKVLQFKDRYVEYEKDDDGKYVLTNGNRNYINGAHNQEIIDFLGSLQEYSLSSEPFTIEGISGKDESWIRNWYREYAQDFTNIVDRLQKGTSTAEDKEILNDFLIHLDEQPKSSQKSESGSESESVVETNPGYKAGSHFGVKPTYGLDGTDTTSTAFTLDQQTMAYIGNLGNIVWLNEDFADMHPSFRAFISEYPNGVFYVNGQLYDANDETLLSATWFKEFVEDNKKNPGSNTFVYQNHLDPQKGWRDFNKFGKEAYYTRYEDFANRRIKDITGRYVLRPIKLNNGTTINIKNLFQVYPINPTNDMYDQFGRIKPEYITYAFIDDKGNLSEIDNYDWNRYISQLERQSSELEDKYYSKVPNYLRRMRQYGGETLVDLDNGLLWLKKKNRYAVIVKTNNGKQVWLLKQGYKPGKNPLETSNGAYQYVEMNNGSPYTLDLSDFGLSLKKHGGTIPKANGGLKIPSTNIHNWKAPGKISGFSPITFETPEWAEEGYFNDAWKRTLPSMHDNIDYIITPQGMGDKNFTITYGIDGRRQQYVPAWYLDRLNNDGRYTQQITDYYLSPKTTNASKPDQPDQPDNHGLSETDSLKISPSEIAGFGRLIGNLQSSYKSKQITEKYANEAKRRLLAMQAPQKTTPKYVEPAENRLIDKQIADLQNQQYAYSDPVLRERMRDKNIATANYLETQKSANSSQAWNQHRMLDMQTKDENSAARINLENNILQGFNGIDQMQMNSELASNNTVATSISNYLLEMQDKFTKFEDQYREAQVAKQNLETIRDYENALEEEFEVAGGYDKLSADSKLLYDQYGFRPAMLKEIAPAVYDNLIRKLQLETSIDRVNYGRSGLLALYPELKQKAKHGAKLSKLSTQMLVNQNKKNVDINQLNKEIMKIFIKLIK